MGGHWSCGGEGTSARGRHGLVATFDEDLSGLRAERSAAALELQRGELRLLTQTRKLLLLEEV